LKRYLKGIAIAFPIMNVAKIIELINAYCGNCPLKINGSITPMNHIVLYVISASKIGTNLSSDLNPNIEIRPKAR
jgi:hypothetical protein